MGTSKVVFNKKALYKTLVKNLTEEQTQILIAYAKEKINEIGDKIQTYPSLNQMDETGNLLDSLCWGVAYKGKLKGSGFYREQSANISSTLHEWFRGSTRPKNKPYGEQFEGLDYSQLPPVWGHALAQHYIETYGERWSENGWRMFIAICAPYWGFWEKGFTLRHRSGSSRFIQFHVMSDFYDTINNEVKPARKTFHVTNVAYSPTWVAKQAKRGLYKNWDIVPKKRKPKVATIKPKKK